MTAQTDSPLVIVASNDPPLQAALVTRFTEEGLACRTANSAADLLFRLEQAEPAALVIDGDFPATKGPELAVRVRQHHLGRRLPTLLLVGEPWAEDERQGFIENHGLIDIVAKPVTVEEVVAAVVNGISAPEVTEDEPLADMASHIERRQVEAESAAAVRFDTVLRGNLLARPFPVLLHQLYREQATGALFLLRDNIKKIVYFTDGHPVYVKSNLLAECLGRVLVREGIINEADCEESLQRMRESRRQQGALLIEMGVISPQNLVVGLELQLQIKLLDVFTWENGEFLFRADTELPGDVIRIDWANATLISEGIRRHWSSERIEEALADDLGQYGVPAPDPQLRFQELPLNHAEESLLKLFDGSRTVREVLEQSELSKEHTLRVVYSVIAAGVIGLADTPLAIAESETKVGGNQEESVREQLAQQLLSLRHRDAFGVLGVSANASDDEVETAYSALARRFHPDRYRQYSVETRHLANKVFRMLFNAHQRVATEDMRVRYRRRHATNEMRAVSVEGARNVAAEKRVRQAQTFIRQQRWKDACLELNSAVELAGEAGELRVLLGWAMFNRDGHEPQAVAAAVREIERGLKLDPDNYHGYLYLGRIYTALGRAAHAEYYYERALHRNPDCGESRTQLTLRKSED